MPPTTRKTSTTKKAAATPKAPAKKRAPRKATTTPPPVTGIAAKRAQMRGEDGTAHDPYAPTVWGEQAAAGQLEDLELPSGQLCLVQRPSPESLMTAGLLDDLDMVAAALPQMNGGKGKGLPPQAENNPTLLKQTITLVDRIAVHIVVKPEITPDPANPADKEIGKIYPSSIALEDRMFLLNYAVGGSRDIARFREELAERVASVDAGEDVPS